MINTSDGYKKAIVASTRRIFAKSIIDIVDPDITYGTVTSSGEMQYSQPKQLYDKDMTVVGTYVTLEQNRWLLNGTQQIYTGIPETEQGATGSSLSDENGVITDWVQLNMNNLSILQACSVYFTDIGINGYALDFKIEIYSGDTLAWSESVTGNREWRVGFEGFIAYDVTRIRVTTTKWSIPERRRRIVEIIPGVYEEWGNDIIYSLDVVQQADFSGLSLPYGTANLVIYNEARRFDPNNKSGLFQSIEARQAIPIFLGVMVEEAPEFISLGVFYQQNGGWQISNDGITITWKLVDIIGLLVNRKYELPDILPTTLSGWFASLVAQLGTNFAERYTIDDELGTTVLECDAQDISNVTCGNLIRWICQAVGAYPIADPLTGYLTAKKLTDVVVQRLGLDNMNTFPSASANTDIASITFMLGDKQQYTIRGTSPTASQTVSVQNPFIKTQEQANAAARNILVNYGGNKITIRGRGDMSAEISDVDAVEMLRGVDVSARRYKQQFQFSGGTMKNVPSYFVQSNGIKLYEQFDVITQSGTWIAPEGVTQIGIILVGGGAGGENGTDGTWDEDGTIGAGGLGGKIWYGNITLNSGQITNVIIGEGGETGENGTATTFGSYSSENGQRFNGYAVIALGAVYGLNGEDGSGINAPANSGNGGGGGAAGQRGITGWDGSQSYIGRYPTDGDSGGKGGSGVAIIFYDIINEDD